jgi:predicted GNAT family acetyltransferase
MDWQSFPRGECRRGHFDELDRFYRAQGAGAWHPLQFETGPYFVYEQDGEIVAAAGTHFAYEGLAQIGNVFTAPASRGKGLAALTTRAVAEALFERGYATLSLFVESTNHTALGVYQRLGFTQHRELAAFEWSSEPFKQAL